MFIFPLYLECYVDIKEETVKLGFYGGEYYEVSTRILAQIVQENKLDIIISSPLKRAVSTSKIVADLCSISIVIDERLIEQNYGIFEGVDRKNMDFLNNKKKCVYKYPNGESMMQVAYRVYGLIDEIKNKYTGQNVLLICHGGVCRIINTYFIDMTNEEFLN